MTKHEKDNDSLKYAYMNSFNPIKALIYPEARINIVKQILTYTNEKNINNNNSVSNSNKL